MDRHANYHIESETDRCIVLRDDGPWDRFMTITNAAEDVIAELKYMLSGRRVFYYDSEGELAELVLKDGKFTGFAHADAGQLVETEKTPVVTETPNIVKVRYFSETTGELSGREYTYFSVDPLKKVKTIPAGSIIPTATFTIAKDTAPETKEALKEMAEKAVDMIKAEHEMPADTPFNDPAVQVRYEAAIDEEQPVPVDNQTAMLRIAPEKDDKIVALYNEGLNLLQLAQGREVRNDADVRLATDDLAFIGGLRKKLDELKRNYEQPFKEHLAAFREVFTRFMQPFEDADRINREKWTAYRRAVEDAQYRAEETNRLAQEVARRQAEESGTGEITVDTTSVTAPQAANTVRSTLGTSSAYKIPKYRILDFKALPDEYKLPDAGKLTRVIKAAKGQIVIPGVEIFFEETLAVRQR